MRWRVLLALLALVGLAAFAPAPFLEKKKAPAQRLEGLWEMDDAVGASTGATRYKIRIEPGKWTFVNVDGKDKGRGDGRVIYFLTLDGKASPPTFDLRRGEKDPAPYGRGIYALNGRELRITYSFQGFRPDTMDTTRPGVFKMALRRVKGPGGR